VNSPDLARTGTTVANLANEFVGKLPVLRAQTESRGGGGAPPPGGVGGVWGDDPCRGRRWPPPRRWLSR
jgi:hypothetical protein